MTGTPADGGRAEVRANVQANVRAIACALASSAAVAVLAACAGGPAVPTLGSGAPSTSVLETGVTTSSGSGEADVSRRQDTGVALAEPEVVSLPRYAITGPAFAPSAAGPSAPQPATRALRAFGQDENPTGVSATTQEQFSVVTLFYATNRVQIPPPSKSREKRAGNGGAVDPTLRFPRFSADRAKHLTLGFAQVTVPNIKRPVGSIKRPRQVTVLSIDVTKEEENPRRHFTIGNLQVLDAAGFYRMASAEGARQREFKDHALIYVHGYNNTLDEALFRTAQLVHDMGFDGVPYAFAWPSKGDTLGYTYDRESADASHGHLADFIDLIAKRTTAKKIHIVAHSMGARLVVDALYPAKAPSSIARSPKLGEVILAAADIDRSVLASRGESIAAAGKPVTLYVADNDYALAASRRFSQSVPRAGDAAEGEPIVMPGVETIDISDNRSVLASFGIGTTIGHTTYAEKSHVLTDMALMMKSSVHPPNRRFPVFTPVTASEAGGTYWRYVKN